MFCIGLFKTDKWAILVIAPEGTTGARLNRQFNALTSEREWCLARKQLFEVVELINEGGKRIAVIRLLHEGVLYE